MSTTNRILAGAIAESITRTTPYTRHDRARTAGRFTTALGWLLLAVGALVSIAAFTH